MAQLKNGEEYLASVYNGKRPEYIMDRVDKSVYPEAEIRQKLAKNRNWLVCSSWLDTKNKKFMYLCAANAHDTVKREVTFAEACADFHWKKFDLLQNEQVIKWYRDPAWDAEVDRIMKKAAKAPDLPEEKKNVIIYRS